MNLKIGCDIVELRRIEKAMQKANFTKILTPKEKALFVTLQGKRQVEWLAGRFAAKEAIYKAIHTTFPCTIADIEILMEEDGAPICTLPECAVQISIAHEAEYAIAYAIAQL